jgi:glucosamine kinase
MIVIADSGSNKTYWLFLNKGHRFTIETPGISMFLAPTDDIQSELQTYFNRLNPESVTNAYFYGSHTGETPGDELIERVLGKIFVRAEIKIEDEILGAARSLLGHEKGIACILDDAANSCYYDGNEVTKKIPTLGFMLGEGGSGAYLGVLFLKDYFDFVVPVDLKINFENELGFDMHEVLKSVFRGEYPRNYLAGLSEFLDKNRNHTYIRNLIKRSFADFFANNIRHYNGLQQHTVNFAGSVAYHYSDLLEEVATEAGVPLGKIIEKPMDGLELFHTI